jgi:DNA repair exonuclease SbcCD ATPase subunit
MDGWKVQLATETETKSGTVKLGVQIIVSSPKSTAAWEAWSGGESQRLRLAMALGLASMIQRASGSWWNLEIFDEPSTFLSTEGVEHLLETLDYRAGVAKKAIWIVDHVALTYANFKEIWSMVKDPVEGSKVRMEARQEV